MLVSSQARFFAPFFVSSGLYVVYLPIALNYQRSITACADVWMPVYAEHDLPLPLTPPLLTTHPRTTLCKSPCAVFGSCSWLAAFFCFFAKVLGGLPLFAFLVSLLHVERHDKGTTRNTPVRHHCAELLTDSFLLFELFLTQKSHTIMTPFRSFLAFGRGIRCHFINKPSLFPINSRGRKFRHNS